MRSLIKYNKYVFILLMKKRPDLIVPQALSAAGVEKLLQHPVIGHRLSRMAQNTHAQATLALHGFIPEMGLDILRQSLPGYHVSVNGAPRQFNITPKPYHEREILEPEDLLHKRRFLEYLYYFIVEYVADPTYLSQHLSDDDRLKVKRTFERRRETDPAVEPLKLLQGIMGEFYIRKALEMMCAAANQHEDLQMDLVQESATDRDVFPAQDLLREQYGFRYSTLGTRVYNLASGQNSAEIDQLIRVSSGAENRIYILEVAASHAYEDFKHLRVRHNMTRVIQPDAWNNVQIINAFFVPEGTVNTDECAPHDHVYLPAQRYLRDSAYEILNHTPLQD